MSATWTSLHPDEAVLVGRKALKTPGVFNYPVPTGANFMRLVGDGCGGQGDHWGGGGAQAKAVVPVTPGENLIIQVGDTSTATTVGDTYVKRNDGVTVIIYADRGRGNGNAGLAINSIGDVTRDGQPGVQTGVGMGGAAASDGGDYNSLGLVGLGSNGGATVSPAGPGGGGHLFASVDNTGNTGPLYAIPAGVGRVMMEFFDTNPGAA